MWRPSATRQYGGVKPGIRGLTRAYSDAVEAALADAGKVRLARQSRRRIRRSRINAMTGCCNLVRRFNARYPAYGDYMGADHPRDPGGKTPGFADFIQMLSPFESRGPTVLSHMP
ncbi:MAG: hypothetical protein U5K27_09785 [Desulfotignum sp.]|nr:hypothetical protein [Desulfotignum sp.]